MYPCWHEDSGVLYFRNGSCWRSMVVFPGFDTRVEALSLLSVASWWPVSFSVDWRSLMYSRLFYQYENIWTYDLIPLHFFYIMSVLDCKFKVGSEMVSTLYWRAGMDLSLSKGHWFSMLWLMSAGLGCGTGPLYRFLRCIDLPWCRPNISDCPKREHAASARRRETACLSVPRQSLVMFVDQL